jgi:hypothetical protein
LIDPLDRAAFGDPSDIDGNSRIVLFFTKAVNDLTPTTSTSYVGGFFHGRDLFPTKETADFAACASSNVGEMFYVMVPDPKRGGPFAKANVASEVLGTLAHEYQHLINASRRMFVNTTATDFEETWLNEGLSHIAEELLFYRVSGLKPRGDLDASAIRVGGIRRCVQRLRVGQLEVSRALQSPSKFSVYSDNDSLESGRRGILSDAADRKATSDGDTWFRLVNRRRRGWRIFARCSKRRVESGAGWGTSVLTDDMTGCDAAYQQPSWNFRSIFAALTSSTVPVATVALATGTKSVTLVGGATSYIRFSVASGSTASVQWSTPPSTVQFTLVRTR